MKKIELTDVEAMLLQRLLENLFDCCSIDSDNFELENTPANMEFMKNMINHQYDLGDPLEKALNKLQKSDDIIITKNILIIDYLGEKIFGKEFAKI